MHRHTILIVEDFPDIAEFLACALEVLGYRTRVASSGRAGLEVAMTEPVDLVLSDLNMPVMDGLGLLAALRGLGHPAPVVLLSASRDGIAASEALRLGAFAFLVKPIALAQLKTVVEAALQSASESP